MKHKKDEAKDKAAEIIELIRYVEIRRDDLDLSDEFAASIYSTWYLINPLGLKDRRAVGSLPPYDETLTPNQRKRAIRFTAHSHSREPQLASPDDLLIYSNMKKSEGTANFIVDDFVCKKIK